MMKKFGISYKGAGENIAKGQKTPQAVVNAWMNSAGHRENILKHHTLILVLAMYLVEIIGHRCLFLNKKIDKTEKSIKISVVQRIGDVSK